MKKQIKYVPITTFAAALAIGSSLSAAENSSLASGMEYQKSQGQVNVSDINSSTGYTTNRRSNSRPITTAEILGMNIDTSSGEKIGEIDEIFVNTETGEVVAVVVSTGGFLDMGDHQTLISPKDLSFNADHSLINADLSKDQLRTAPRYKTGDTKGLDQVRPLTKSGQDWDAQSHRENQINTRSGSQANYGLSTSEENTNERSQTGNKSQSNRQGIAVSDLIGMDVENRQGEEVGEIEQVFLDLNNQKVVGVIVSTGGFIGIGERQTLIGLSELSFTDANEAVVVNYSSDQIKAFPEFKSNDPSVFNDLENRTNRLPSNVNGSLRAEKRNNNKDSSAVTVFDQGNSSDELAMSASIRRAIREDESLSSRANNVSIITKDKKVVLRGEVDSASEKASVERIAHNKAGRLNVTSELTVSNRRGHVSQ